MSGVKVMGDFIVYRTEESGLQMNILYLQSHLIVHMSCHSESDHINTHLENVWFLSVESTSRHDLF